MKIKKHTSPSKNTVNVTMVKPTYSAMLEIDIEQKQDIQKCITEINSFIGADLSQYRVFVCKIA